MRKFIFALPILLFLSSASMYAQEQLGLRLDKYSGVNALSLNPASGAHFALSWDLNLVGAGLFMEQNYLFASPTNVPHLIENSDDIGFAPDMETFPATPVPSILVDFYDDNKERFFSSYTEVLGPSLLININETHAIGFQTKLRSAVGGFNIDNDLSYYKYQDISLGNPLEIEPFAITGMVWQEYALSYSYAQDFGLTRASFGGSLKLMKAYESFFLNVSQPILSTKIMDDSLALADFDVSMGFTTASQNLGAFANEFTGQGFGLDIGMSFIIDPDEGDYFAKFGVAILDIGKVNFDRQSEKYRLQTTNATSLSASDFDGVNTKEEAFSQLSTAITGDSLAAKQPAGYSLWAPTALSVQGGIQFQKNLYIGGSWIQRIPFSPLSVKRNNTLAVAPRFETRWFSLGVPMVLYNWQDFRLGTSMRIGFLTIGSDNLGGFVGKKALTGMDFYFSLKANPFTLNFLGGSGDRRKGKSVKCYKF